MTKPQTIPSQREMIDWLGLFVAPRIETKHDNEMYMHIRNLIAAPFNTEWSDKIVVDGLKQSMRYAPDV